MANVLTRHLYDQVLAGHRDILATLLHPDFVLAGTQEHLDRDSWLDLMIDATTWETIDVEVTESSIALGNAFVITARVRYGGLRDDGPLTGTWNVIDVWHQRGVDWQLLSRTTFGAT